MKGAGGPLPSNSPTMKHSRPLTMNILRRSTLGTLASMGSVLSLYLGSTFLYGAMGSGTTGTGPIEVIGGVTQAAAVPGNAGQLVGYCEGGVLCAVDAGGGPAGPTGATGPAGATGATGATGPAGSSSGGGGSTPSLLYYGDGSDGSLVVSGTIQQIRDMYWQNYSFQGSGFAAYYTNGWRDFVAGTWDISSINSQGIQCSVPADGIPGVNCGGTGSGGDGGVPIGYGSVTSLPVGGLGGAGGAGQNGTTGLPGQAGSFVSASNGGNGGNGGAGGLGSFAGGLGADAGLGNNYPLDRFTTTPGDLGWSGNNPLPGAGNGGGGGGGASGTVSNGAGGGGGGGGAGFVFFSAAVINNSNTGQSNGVQCIGGAGGAGGTCTSFASYGAAGGGGGGEGGEVLIAFGAYTGNHTSNSAFISVNGGNGASGGQGNGNVSYGGNGGAGGGGGNIAIMNLSTSVVTLTICDAGSPGTDGGSNGGAGAGGTGATCGGGL